MHGQANQYGVLLEAARSTSADPTSVSKLFIPSTNGSQVPDGTFAAVEHTVRLTISHLAQFPPACRAE